MRIDLPDTMLDEHYAQAQMVVPGVMKCRGVDIANEGTGGTMGIAQESAV
jgi:hypothetical protein